MKTWRIGDWRVSPSTDEISLNGDVVRLEARTMRLLMCLAERRGEVVSIEEMLKLVWPDVSVTPDSVYQAVASLRRVLGDDPKQPTYIATVPRLGYRMVASAEPIGEGSAGSRRGRVMAIAVLSVALLVAAVAGWLVTRRYAAGPRQQSIAVLPFLDLTEHMKEEEFADGVTEELIDRLNKIPGLRVPPPTASFYYKNKRRSIPEIAKALDVAYVLDGSTRKSGDRLRVAARLIRAGDGLVVWSDSYDRAWGDILTVQDDIAGQVTKALTASIDLR